MAIIPAAKPSAEAEPAAKATAAPEEAKQPEQPEAVKDPEPEPPTEALPSDGEAPKLDLTCVADSDCTFSGDVVKGEGCCPGCGNIPANRTSTKALEAWCSDHRAKSGCAKVRCGEPGARTRGADLDDRTGQPARRVGLLWPFEGW